MSRSKTDMGRGIENLRHQYSIFNTNNRKGTNIKYRFKFSVGDRGTQIQNTCRDRDQPRESDTQRLENDAQTRVDSSKTTTDEAICQEETLTSELRGP